MRIKSLIILILITVAMVFITNSLLNKQVSTAEVDAKINTLVFPKLANIINDIGEITITSKDNNFTLLRNQNAEVVKWQLKEKHNYSADTNKINKTLVALSLLNVKEAKTSNPKYYPKLGVEDITIENSQAILLSLKDKNSKDLFSLFIGKSKNANELYIRKANDKQALLVNGNLSVEKEQIDWLNKAIMNIEAKDVREIAVNDIRVYKDKVADKEYKLADIQTGQKLINTRILNNIANVLSNLSMTDVIPQFEFSAETVKTVFTLFDETTITVTSMKKDDKNYAKFVVTGKNKDKYADLLTWVYQLSDYSAGNLQKQMSDLVENEEPIVEDDLANSSTMSPSNILKNIGK
jgi:hypothetical protein